MKVLQVNVVYNQGSTGKIVADLHTSLKEHGMESIVCYGSGPQVNEAGVYKLVKGREMSLYSRQARLFGLQYAVGCFSTSRLLKTIQATKPDVVHLHCLNGFFVNIYRLMRFLKRNGIPTVLTLHAEFMYTGSCGHAFDCERWKTGCGHCPQLWAASQSRYFDRTATAWKSMRSAFQGFDRLTIVCVSPWVQSRAVQSPILEGHKPIVIENGLESTKIFHPILRDNLKKQLGIQEEKVILHVTASFSKRETDLKGGHYVYDLAERLKNESIKIVIVGSREDAPDFLPNMINAGKVKDQSLLAEFYSMADLTVITSKRETFSMVTAESLCCGTPVVGFLAGGPESIALPGHSEFVEYGNTQDLTDCVKRWLTHKQEHGEEIPIKARERYSKQRMFYRYEDVYAATIHQKEDCEPGKGDERGRGSNAEI